MRKLNIDWSDLELAFETFGSDPALLSEHDNYFDLETGRVVFMTDDLSSALDRIEEELEDQLPPDGQVTADMLRATGAFQSLSEWEQEAVLRSANLRFGDFGRFEAIPGFQSRESYGYMEDFIESVRDPAMQEKLDRAIHERHPFRRFREVLATDRRLDREWVAYERGRQREAIIEWLNSIGVEPANPDEGVGEPPPLPD